MRAWGGAARCRRRRQRNLARRRRQGLPAAWPDAEVNAGGAGALDPDLLLEAGDAAAAAGVLGGGASLLQ